MRDQRSRPLPQPLRLLILGGTTEANRLAESLSGREDVRAILSLAGRTQHPVLPAIPARIGGFGGIAGLTDYLTAERIGALIDATHPFAAQISAHAAQACARLGVPRAILTRPPWTPQPGDPWTDTRDLDGAAAALGPEPKRVFLTTGRLGLKAFKAAPHHDYVLRTIDPPDPADCPPRCSVILARGPFDLAAEIALLRAERIDTLVSKNSGGAAGAAKIAAARHLGLRVIMVERPPTPAGLVLTDIDACLRWIATHGDAP